MGVLCIFWIIKSLPSLPGEPSHQKQNTFRLLQRPGVMAGMIAIFMSFAGQFAFFTYIRPVYMNLAGFGVDGLTLVLLSFGIASFIGTSLSSFILKRSVKLALAGAPLILAVSALVLTLWGSDKIVATGVAIIWGLTLHWFPSAGQRGSPARWPIRQKKPGLFRWRLFSLLIPVARQSAVMRWIILV